MFGSASHGMSGDLPAPPDTSAPRRDSDESKISSDPSRRESVSSSEIRAVIAEQAQTIRRLLAAQRDEAAAQRDEAARREADLVRQRDEAVRREADLVRQRDEAVRRADEERAERLRLQGAWHCIVS